MAIYKSPNKNYSDYYFDSTDNAVYSTKQGRPYKLAFSYKGALEKRRVAIGSGYYKTTVRRDQLTSFFTELQGVSAKPVVASGGFIVGSRSGDQFSFSPTPRVHSTLFDAKTEAERLAKLQPAKRFVVMGLMGSVKASGVTWE